MWRIPRKCGALGWILPNDLTVSGCWGVIQHDICWVQPAPPRMTGWWFQRFFIFTPTWGKKHPIWLILFKWVGSTTNYRWWLSPWFSRGFKQPSQVFFFAGCFVHQRIGCTGRCFPMVLLRGWKLEFFTDPSQKKTCKIEFPMQGWLLLLLLLLLLLWLFLFFSNWDFPEIGFQTPRAGIHPLIIYNKSM